jgi:uncharacterized protein with FMN-binding domain
MMPMQGYEVCLMDEQVGNSSGGEPQLPVPGAPPEPAPGKAKRSSRRKLILGMSIALIALLIIAGLIGGLYAWRFLKVANALTIDEVDISRVPDGVYEGSYSVFHVKAAVEVEVADGRIVSIDFTDSGKMSEEARQEINDIFGEVISSQSLDVDITSGASVSKKVSLKAVEEALGGSD